LEAARPAKSSEEKTDMAVRGDASLSRAIVSPAAMTET
jgi:hypothetical protein